MAATRWPSSLPEWATGVGRTLEPAAGEKVTGWQVDDRPPARIMNWLQNLAYEWMTYLDHVTKFEVASILWEQATVSAGAGADILYAITHDGAGVIVAVGAAGQVFHSDDHGLTWAAVAVGADDFRGLVFAEALFVACHDNEGIETSPTGAVWTTRVTPAGVYALMDVAHGDGNFVSVGGVGAAVNARIIVSADAITWTEEYSNAEDMFFSIVYADTIPIWIAAGDAGNMRSAVDPTGAWTARASGTGNDINGLAWDGTTIVGVGDNGTIITSVNGTAWGAATTVPTTTNLNNVRYFEELGVFVAVGSGIIVYSYDGDIWYDARPGLVRAQQDCMFDDDVFIVCGDANEDVYISIRIPS